MGPTTRGGSSTKKYYTVEGSSKRPREGDMIDLVEEEDDMRKRIMELEEGNRRLKEVEIVQKEEDDMSKRITELEEENRRLREVEMEHKEVMKELKGMIECPVCLSVPRQRSPMPVCSNGHFICISCRDRIRQEAGDEVEAKCPSCLVNLGTATSLLASKVIQCTKHECEHEGCEEMIPFSQLEKHSLACVFRRVLCPGCGIEMAFKEVAEHIWSCKDAKEDDLKDDEVILKITIPRDEVEDIEEKEWKTSFVTVDKKMFFVQSKRENHFFYCEVIILGSAEECKAFVASLHISEKANTYSTKSPPRPISLENWGCMGLCVQEKALSNIWTLQDDHYTFMVYIHISKA